MINIKDFDPKLIKLDKKSFINIGVDNKSGEYGKDYTKIKLNSDDDLLLNKQLKFLSIAIIVTCVFEENRKYYPQIFVYECFYQV